MFRCEKRETVGLLLNTFPFILIEFVSVVCADRKIHTDRNTFGFADHTEVIRYTPGNTCVL